jgi:hypothetical protein
MFEDLSLRFIKKNKLVWTVEQSISKVDKVEVFDATMPTVNVDSAAHTLSYVHKMGDKISIAEVPVRIMQRYVENARFFVSSVMSMFNPEDKKLASTKQSDIESAFGFHKTLVLLTKPGKIVAISSADGSIKWTYFDPQEKAVNVLIEQTDGVDAHLDIIVVSENFLTYIDPWTGAQRKRESLVNKNGQSDSFILVGTEVETAIETVSTQAVLSVPKDTSDAFKVQIHPENEKLSGSEPLFYTQVDKSAGKIIGYSINKTTLKANKMWNVSFASNNASGKGKSSNMVIEDIYVQF